MSKRVIDFPKQPVMRRRVTHWCVILWPFFVLLIAFIVIAVLFHDSQTCEPYTGC